MCMVNLKLFTKKKKTKQKLKTKIRTIRMYILVTEIGFDIKNYKK